MKSRGFIALMTAIIISAILLIVIVVGGLVGFYSRFNVLDAESKERSSALADACAENIRLQLATSGSVSAGDVVVGDDSCEIVTDTSPYEIQAVFNDSYTNVQVGIDPDTFEVTSWEEVANL